MSHRLTALNQDALARLHFNILAPAEQEAAVRRLAATGHGPDTIARATGLSIEFINRILTGEAA